jgi:hypothetical protein
VDAENCGKLCAPALPFAGKVDMLADHAGAFDCGVEAADVLAAPLIVLGMRLPAAYGSFGGADELILPVRPLRPETSS